MSGSIQRRPNKTKQTKKHHLTGWPGGVFSLVSLRYYVIKYDQVRIRSVRKERTVKAKLIFPSPQRNFRVLALTITDYFVYKYSSIIECFIINIFFHFLVSNLNMVAFKI